MAKRVLHNLIPAFLNPISYFSPFCDGKYSFQYFLDPKSFPPLSHFRASFMDVWPVEVHIVPHSEDLWTWLNAVLLPSWKLQLFWNKPHLFILLWSPQSGEPVLPTAHLLRNMLPAPLCPRQTSLFPTSRPHCGLSLPSTSYCTADSPPSFNLNSY